MNTDNELYLVWSHEHGAWWGPYGNGYMRSLAAAGRYSHAEALRICIREIPGTSQDLGALPELPVRETDVLALRDGYREKFPHLPIERWE